MKELAPGAFLAVAVEAFASGDLSGRPAAELLGAAGAARKIAAWIAAAGMRIEAEFAARNMDSDPETGELEVDRSAAVELAAETRLTRTGAKVTLERSHAGVQRFGKCLGLLTFGFTDPWSMNAVADGLTVLDDEAAARADKWLAERIAGKTVGQVRAKVREVLMMLDPEGTERRREEGSKRRRLQVFQEASGNGSVSVREGNVADVLAIQANADRWARIMRAAGIEGPLDLLRADAVTALMLEQHPVTGAPRPAGTADPMTPAAGRDGGPWDGLLPQDQDPAEAAEDPDAQNFDPWAPREDDDPFAKGTVKPASQGAPQAVIHILAAAGALDGTSNAPVQVAGFGPLPGTAGRDLIAAASQNPATRWCITEVDDQGLATAHGCARGPRRWTPPQRATGPPATGPPATGPPATGPPRRDPLNPGPPGPQVTSFLHGLNVTFEPIARGECDHRHAEPQHDPSRKLRHLVLARNAGCVAPGCSGTGVKADLDHTVAWADGGISCECNLGPMTKAHHRCKHSTGWTVTSNQPGWFTWTGPAGLSHMTGPTRYEL
jgi:hypothetical protein